MKIQWKNSTIGMLRSLIFDKSLKRLIELELTNDDTTSICPNVRQLIVNIPCTNLPNTYTLTILHEDNLSCDECIQFRRLNHLTTRHIHTLTLFEINDLLTHSIIYSNIQNLILKMNKVDSLTSVRSLVQHFPNLHSFKIYLPSNDEYYDSLNLILDREHLPYLSLLKTNWISKDTSDIRIWISANTPLR
ncbi:unnamed protein product [Rotaria sp. Silwood1]|nr:unnamed protein product [Rotaria sp. Silwood1]CAF1135804.1 unnamed protein product [Rotaria sp. Silwood1]